MYWATFILFLLCFYSAFTLLLLCYSPLSTPLLLLQPVTLNLNYFDPGKHLPNDPGKHLHTPGPPNNVYGRIVAAETQIMSDYRGGSEV